MSFYHFSLLRFLLRGLLVPLLLGLSLAACSTAETPEPSPTLYLYLAGPGVFLDEAQAYGQARKARIQALAEAHDWPVRVEGLYPLDNEIAEFAPDRETGLRIYRANMGQIKRAHAVIANMVRFRGPSMDVGTAFEMGVARGMNKPVFAYYDAVPFFGSADFGEGSAQFDLPAYADRVSSFYGASERLAKDPDGLNIEHFEMSDNLMLLGALDDSATGVQSSFDQAVVKAVQHLLRNVH